MSSAASAAAPMLRLWWRLGLLGTIGAASMLLAPLERLVPAPIDPMTLRLLAIVQPTVLVWLMALLGAWAAPKVGFDAPAVRAWAEGRPIFEALRPQLPAALLGGIIVAFILVAFGLLVRSDPIAAPLLVFEIPLVTKILYGGIVEELLLRWGLMSFIAWAVWRLAGRPQPVPAWSQALGLVVAALLFAVGHLPVLYLLLPDPPAWLVAAVLVGNVVPGLLFGWLFWRSGLEAAMIAHALAHLFAVAALALL